MAVSPSVRYPWNTVWNLFQTAPPGRHSAAFSSRAGVSSRASDGQTDTAPSSTSNASRSTTHRLAGSRRHCAQVSWAIWLMYQTVFAPHHADNRADIVVEDFHHYAFCTLCPLPLSAAIRSMRFSPHRHFLWVVAAMVIAPSSAILISARLQRVIERMVSPPHDNFVDFVLLIFIVNSGACGHCGPQRWLSSGVGRGGWLCGSSSGRRQGRAPCGLPMISPASAAKQPHALQHCRGTGCWCSLAQAKWMNHHRRRLPRTSAKRFFSQYSMVLTSWLVVASMALTAAASSNEVQSPRRFSQAFRHREAAALDTRLGGCGWSA